MTSLYHVSDSMSLDLNKVQLIGRSTATVTTKLIEPSNIAVVNFTVVTNRKYKNAQWVLMSDSEYHKCTAYGNSADILGKYLTKGKKVYVEWRLKTRKWTDGAGVERSGTEIIVDNFIFLDNKDSDSDDVGWDDDIGAPLHDEAGIGA